MQTRRAFLIAAGTALAASGCATITGRERAVPAQGLFHQPVMDVGGKKRKYAVYVTPEYTPDRKWPLVVFLHGASRRGNDGWDQTYQGLGPAMRAHPERFPCIAVMPQCPKGKRWPDTADHIDAAVAQTMSRFPIDPNRVYLTGLSMGGFGTLYYGAKRPERYAAMIAIAGGARGWVVDSLTQTPLWLFHNKGDNVVPVTRSREMVAAFKRAGAPVRYTEYGDRGHDAWTRAYNDPEVSQWLFHQQKA